MDMYCGYQFNDLNLSAEKLAQISLFANSCKSTYLNKQTEKSNKTEKNPDSLVGMGPLANE